MVFTKYRGGLPSPPLAVVQPLCLLLNLLLELQRVLLSFLPHELCKKGQNTCRSLLT